MKKNSSRRGKIALLIIILIIAAAAAFFSLIFWNSSYSVKEYKFSQDIFDKIIESQKSGGTVKLDSEELNGLLTSFVGSNRTSGSIEVRGINAEITDSTLKFYMPVTYKKFNFLMTSEGRVYLKNNSIMYDPSYFKLGKISIPENYVLGKLSGKLNNRLKVEENAISIPSSLIPISMDSIEVQNKMLVIKVAEGGMSVDQKLNWFKNTIKSAENAEQSGSAQSGSAENGVQNSSGKGSTQSGGKSEAQGNNQTDGNDASKSTASVNEQAVISEIVSAVNSRNKAALISAQADYNKLSPEGKKRVEAAVVSGLDKNTLEKIKEKGY